MDEIVIYVENFYPDFDSKCVTVECDFKSDADYIQFAELFNLPTDGATGFQIEGVKLGGIKTEKYYKFNTKTIVEKFDCEVQNDSWVMGFTLRPKDSQKPIAFNEIATK